MKKFMKFCGILVAIAIIIGLVLLLVGSAGGGLPKIIEQIKNGELNIGPEDFGWNGEWTTYSLGDGDMFNGAYEKIEEEDLFETSFSAAEIDKLAMNLGGCEVKLVASPDASYHIRVEQIGTFQTYVEDGTLHINGIWAKTGVFGKSINMKVEIMVPDDASFKSVNLELGAGVFHIDFLKTNSLVAEIGAGQLTIDGLWADDFVCEVGAGQAVIENAKFVNDVALSVGAGELKLTGEIPCDMDVECGMGNVVIKVLNSSEKDHNFEMDCAAGNLRAGSHSISGLAGDKSVDNGAASTYKLECAMGNMTVSFVE